MTLVSCLFGLFLLIAAGAPSARGEDVEPVLFTVSINQRALYGFFNYQEYINQTVGGTSSFGSWSNPANLMIGAIGGTSDVDVSVRDGLLTATWSLNHSISARDFAAIANDVSASASFNIWAPKGDILRVEMNQPAVNSTGAAGGYVEFEQNYVGLSPIYLEGPALSDSIVYRGTEYSRFGDLPNFGTLRFDANSGYIFFGATPNDSIKLNANVSIRVENLSHPIAPTPKTFVLVAGVDYAGGRGAFGSIDAASIRDAFFQLPNQGEYNIQYLHLDEQNKATNKQLLTDAINRIKAQVRPGDDFILSLTGHGVNQRFQPAGLLPEPESLVEWFGQPPTISDSSIEDVLRYQLTGRLSSNADEYFDLGDYKNESGRISDNELADLFRDPAWNDVNKMFLMGMCYGGGMWGGPGDLNSLPNSFGIAAASEADRGLWNKEAVPYTLFSRALVDALSKDDIVYPSTLLVRMKQWARRNGGDLQSDYYWTLPENLSASIDVSDQLIPFRPIEFSSYGIIPEPTAFTFALLVVLAYPSRRATRG